MAKHLATCEKKSAYPSLSDAKSASVTHSMLDVLGLVRKPEEADRKVYGPRSVKRAMRKAETGIIALDEDESSRDSVKSTRGRKPKKQHVEPVKKAESEVIVLIDAAEEGASKLKSGDKPVAVENVDILATADAGENSDKPIILEDDSNDSLVTTKNVEGDEKLGTVISSAADTEDDLKPSDLDKVSPDKDLEEEMVKEKLVNDQEEIVELPPPEETEEVLNAGSIAEAQSPKDETISEDSKNALESEALATVGEDASTSTSKETGDLLISESLNELQKEPDTPLVCAQSNEDNVSAPNVDTNNSLENMEGTSASLDVIESISASEKCLETSPLRDHEPNTTATIEPLPDIENLSEQTGQADKSDLVEETDDSQMDTESVSVPAEPSSEVLPNLEKIAQESKTISVAEESAADNNAPVTPMEVD